jgi:hypothetical protein
VIDKSRILSNDFLALILDKEDFFEARSQDSEVIKILNRILVDGSRKVKDNQVRFFGVE